MKREVAQRLGLDGFEDPEEELAVGLLLIAGRLIQRLDEACKKWGITDDQYNVLRILKASSPQGLPRFAIAERLISRSPDVTRLLDRLEAKGLVRRTRSGPDRRRSISVITPAGLDLLRQMSSDVKSANLELTEALSPPEMEAFASVLGRLVRREEDR